MHTWLKDDWIGSSARKASGVLWRAVEAQHMVATMSLVDTLDEQYMLEHILEASKPPVPKDAAALHYLLFTPFRYTSDYPSRFRAPKEPGIWYGAFDRQTACAEVGYWRWRFLMDSAGLRGGDLKTEHTLFQARVTGQHIDLTRTPWNTFAKNWCHPSDYSHCQQLAREARSRELDWLRYDSARHPRGDCAAVLRPQALQLHEPERSETWICRVTRAVVIFRHQQEGFSFEPDQSGLRSMT